VIPFLAAERRAKSMTKAQVSAMLALAAER